MKLKPPNLIFFNPDQWRADTIGHHGNPAAVTPNLDRWASEEAISFRHAYCQNPVCTPSRCSFMTGLYPHVRGHRTMFHMLHPERDETNLLKLLKENGYFIWWGGKNDLVPAQDGYEAYCNIKYQASETDRARWGLTHREGPHGGNLDWRGDPGGDNYYSFYKGKLDKGAEPIYLDKDWEIILGAIDFLNNFDGDQPICLYLPLDYPHPPYGVEEPYYSLIDRSKLPPRIPATGDWQGKPAVLEQIAVRQGLRNWSEERWNELRAVYYAMCARVDDQFSRLVTALRENDLYEESAIFFFSDHGDYTGDYGLVEKTQNTFEESLVNVPFLLKPPARIPRQPGVNNALVELVDFFATVIDLTGIDPGYSHFGRSLLPLLRGDHADHRQAVFCEGGRLYGEIQAMELESSSHQNPEGLYWPRVGLQSIDDAPYHGKAAMCRTRRFKYIHRLYEQDELYDLQNDPQELHSCVHDPAYTTTLIEMKERLLSWYMETADVVPRQTDQRW